MSGLGLLFAAVLAGAVLSGVPVGIALLVLEVNEWRANRRTRHQVTFHPKPKHVKGEPTVRIPIAPIGGAS